MRKLAACLLVFLLATASHAGLKDRLEPIVSSGNNTHIFVDTFIIGTEDLYVARLVRRIGPEEIADMRFTMLEMLGKYDKDSLILIERYLLDKKTKKMALMERNMALNDNPETIISSEPMLNADLLAVTAGSTNEKIWTAVAGPKGVGRRILSDEPKPVVLSADKTVKDGKRYATIARGEIGGVFLDRQSIRKSEHGVTAVTVETYGVDEEVQIGGLVHQYAGLPYKDAVYAISTSEYSFARRAFRQLRFTVFGRNQDILYSVRIANPTWATDGMNPLTTPLLRGVAENMPGKLAGELSSDIKTFNGHVDGTAGNKK